MPAATRGAAAAASEGEASEFLVFLCDDLKFVFLILVVKSSGKFSAEKMIKDIKT